MGYIIRYARAGNAVPLYSVTRCDGANLGLFSSVDSVYANLNRSRRSVQTACKEAREEGVSHFLDD